MGATGSSVTPFERTSTLQARAGALAKPEVASWMAIMLKHPTCRHFC
jgi:hypothetical protein